MKKMVFLSLLVLAIGILISSCGTDGGNKSVDVNELQTAYDKLPAGDAARGEQIFLAQPCHTCHVDVPVGPAFPGDPPLAVRAGTGRPGYSAEVYLYESIIEPDADVVPGFQKDIMPDDFSKTLTEQELADLIAYLMTMK